MIEEIRRIGETDKAFATTASSRTAATGTGLARVVTFAHRAPLISTMPHGAPRLAEIATVDTTRSHAGAPVRDGLRLINA
jgi:hypothetical protein